MTNEYIYAVLLLQKLGKPVNVESVRAIVKAGGHPDPSAWQIMQAVNAIQSRDRPHILRDDEGTSMPAATTPKIYTGGGGDNRGPPVAGAVAVKKEKIGFDRELDVLYGRIEPLGKDII